MIELNLDMVQLMPHQATALRLTQLFPHLLCHDDTSVIPKEISFSGRELLGFAADESGSPLIVPRRIAPGVQNLDSIKSPKIVSIFGQYGCGQLFQFTGLVLEMSCLLLSIHHIPPTVVTSSPRCIVRSMTQPRSLSSRKYTTFSK